MLAQKFAAGLFEDSMTHSTNASLAVLLDNPVHRRVALEAAEQGIVMLLNRNDTLPLTLSALERVGAYGGGKGVALIGEASSCVYDNASAVGIGGRAARRSGRHDDQCPAQLDMLGKTQHKVGNVDIVTVADAISRINAAAAAADADAASPMPLSGTRLGAFVDMPTPEDEKAAAVALAASSSMALLVLGDSEKSCGEWGDRSTLSLPGDQPELLRRVLETGVPTVLVLVHGRPVSFDIEPSSNPAGHTSLLDYPNLAAVLAAWRPGEEGGVTVVNALRGTMVTGAGGPSGRLPQAWPQSAGQIGGTL